MKKALSAAWGGIKIASTVFIISSFFVALSAEEGTFASTSGMLRNCLTIFAIGTGFGIPSLIYETKLSMPVKVLIHMGIGCSVMVAAAIINGWARFSGEHGVLIGLAVIAGQMAVAFIIWFIQYRRSKKLAARMNRKLGEQ
ncbi:MAG: DUF3021 domain-containing protein [Clostridia bacterium]|nr:DUF3021 domain-containing protein [Clostridia bacterium]